MMYCIHNSASLRGVCTSYITQLRFIMYDVKLTHLSCPSGINIFVYYTNLHPIQSQVKYNRRCVVSIKANVRSFQDKVYKPANVESTIGSSGVTVQVGTNYFNVTVKDNMPFYQYRVDFLPEVIPVYSITVVPPYSAIIGAVLGGTTVHHKPPKTDTYSTGT